MDKLNLVVIHGDGKSTEAEKLLIQFADLCLLFNDPDATKWNDEIMTNACWTLEGLLAQVEILVEGNKK